MAGESVLPFLFLFFSVSAATGDTLTASHPLSDGETLVSTNGTFALGFFSPPNTTNRFLGIWYHSLSVKTIVWVANRDNPIIDLSATLSIASEGTSLRLTAPGNSSTLVWSSPSFPPNTSSSPIAQILDTGNLIIKASLDSSAPYLWQSFDHPTDTMLSGMKVGVNLKSGIQRNLTPWRSSSDPSPGNYTLTIDPHGVPQMVTRTTSGSWFWRGGSWNGFGFTGASPNQFFDLNLYQVLLQSFIDTPDEIYYVFSNIGGAISILKIDHGGILRRYVWQPSLRGWSANWIAPLDACDFFKACGVNAVCESKKSPICGCLDGFEPRNPADWEKGNWSEGCVRSVAIDCQADGDDDFVVVHGAKLPDTTEAAEDMRLGLDECRARCSMNCSCSAYASANFNDGGKGCILWMAEIKDLRVGNSGDALYVRVAATNAGHKRKPWVFGVTAAAAALFISTLVLCAFMIRRRSHKKSMNEQVESYQSWGDQIIHNLEANKEGCSEISFFSFAQLISATNNFSDINKLGEGGFGPVYEGKLQEGQHVAIKRLSARSGQGAEEFKNEILLIAKLQHRNLVSLLGCCIHEEEKLLIYEFMPNKSLDILLFDGEEGSKLDWRRRFQIIEGIAQGLLYLHKHSRFTVVHRDLKASNILLDADMNPKISDFGMARIFNANETQANTRRIMGTFGYMAPEYAFKGHFSIKSDVYSFGVLLLEIVSGRRNSCSSEDAAVSCNRLARAWDLWNEGAWAELVDPTIMEEMKNRHDDDMAKCIYVALLCVQESPEDRPVMSDVVSMLGNQNLRFGDLMKPAFFTTKVASAPTLPFKLNGNNSLNDISVSVVLGR